MNKMKMYSNWPAAFRRFFDFICCIALFLFLNNYAQTNKNIANPAHFQDSIWHKWSDLFIAATTYWFKSFAIFTSQEVLMIATG